MEYAESYDFTGKTLVPFCTSGGSPIGKAPEHMQDVVKNGTVVAGKTFSWNASNEDIAQWVEQYR